MDQETIDSIEKKRSPLRRLTAIEVQQGIELLREAVLNLVPDAHTQRSAFNNYLLELYVLRENGYTFKQLTALLKQCGFNLQSSSVRTYYYELVKERENECVRYLEAQRKKSNSDIK
jgi:hypothetical protein